MLNSFSLTNYQEEFYLNKANFIIKIICLFVFVSLMAFNHETAFHIILLIFTMIALLMTNLSSRGILMFFINNLIFLLPIFLITLLLFNSSISLIIGLKILVVSLYMKVIFTTTSKKEIIRLSIKFLGSYLTWFFYALFTFSNNFINYLNKIKISYYLKGINYDKFNYKLKLKFVYYNIKNVLIYIKKHNEKIKKDLLSMNFINSKMSYKVSMIDMGLIFVHLVFLILVVIRG